MFKIEEDPNRTKYEDKKIVIDHDRGVSLKFLRSPGPGGEPDEGDTYRLTWGSRTIAFVALRQSTFDQDIGKSYYLCRFLKFGTKGYGRMHAAVEAYPFESEDERHQAMMLAVEAMLLMSSHYSGDTRPDGYDRVEYRGHLYTKSDFGMS